MDSEAGRVRLDLNNPVFQRHLFGLTQEQQRSVLNTLKKLSDMTWNQVYRDRGLKWEMIAGRAKAGEDRLYTLRIGKGFKAVGLREGDWLRLLSLHPDRDSAYP